MKKWSYITWVLALVVAVVMFPVSTISAGTINREVTVNGKTYTAVFDGAVMEEEIEHMNEEFVASLTRTENFVLRGWMPELVTVTPHSHSYSGPYKDRLSSSARYYEEGVLVLTIDTYKCDERRTCQYFAHISY